MYKSLTIKETVASDIFINYLSMILPNLVCLYLRLSTLVFECFLRLIKNFSSSLTPLYKGNKLLRRLIFLKE